MTPEELEGRVSTLREHRRDYQNLLQDRGFARVVATLQQQADTLQNEVVFGRLTKLDDALPLERKRGRLEGLLELTRAVETAVEAIDFELRQLIGDENASRTDSGRGTAGDFRASP